MVKKLILYTSGTVLALTLAAASVIYSRRVDLTQEFFLNPMNKSMASSGYRLRLLGVNLRGLQVGIDRAIDTSNVASNDSVQLAIANIAFLSRPWASTLPLHIELQSVTGPEPLKGALQSSSAQVTIDRKAMLLTINLKTAIEGNSVQVQSQINLAKPSDLLSGRATILVPQLKSFGTFKDVEWTYRVSTHDFKAKIFSEPIRAQIELALKFDSSFQKVKGQLSPLRSSSRNLFDRVQFSCTDLKAPTPEFKFEVSRLKTGGLDLSWPQYLKHQSLNVQGRVLLLASPRVELKLKEPFGRFEIAVELKQQRLLANTVLDFDGTLRFEDLIDHRDLQIGGGRLRISFETSLAADRRQGLMSVDLQGRSMSGLFKGVNFGGLDFELATKIQTNDQGLDLDQTSISKGAVTLSKLGQKNPIGPFELSASKTVGGKIVCQKIEAQMFKGIIRVLADPVTLNPLVASGKIVVEGVDLKTFFSTLDFNRITGVGTLVGGGPFRFDSDGLIISQMQLKALEPGTVTYKDPSIVDVKRNIVTLGEFQDLLGRGSQALAFKALDNFHYTKLELNVSRRPPQIMSADVHLKGSNPELARGQIFELNLPITGDLETLLKRSLLDTLVQKAGFEQDIENMMENR